MLSRCTQTSRGNVLIDSTHAADTSTSRLKSTCSKPSDRARRSLTPKAVEVAIFREKLLTCRDHELSGPMVAVDISSSQPGLRKELNLFDIAAIVVGTIIGSGIFLL